MGSASVSKMALEGSFICWNGTSIRLGQACDFIRDCLEGEDEGDMCKNLPPGFYCSFEEGDCGWMHSSSASRASPWRIGSPDYDRFPSIEGCGLIFDTSKAPAAANTAMTSTAFPAPLRNSPCENNLIPPFSVTQEEKGDIPPYALIPTIDANRLLYSEIMVRKEAVKIP
ncbi:ALK tyrosine kinase receptor-like [Aythya fuligula]|uniref:ALK tyrosine kinase receptor-like n=1 Tax=Aythya fuligula TaxID=219594 RepID=A0A6J3CKW1_AYTFU|nr:ALK tyrosine kinase receptor-like [Aythya fuligula]